MTNKLNTVLYIGVTNSLIKRIYQHRTNAIEGFTSRYNLTKLVWFEVYEDIHEAILREKQLKGGSRKKKIELIEKMNPSYQDLYETII